MKDREDAEVRNDAKRMGRRRFLQLSEGLAAGGALLSTLLPGEAIAAVAASGGYLVVDTKKCQGCVSCMIACSLVHEGEASLSRSRIQVLQNPFDRWPHDISIQQCRQCVDPACLTACRFGAVRVDPKRGNVREIDRDKCTGCEACIDKCHEKHGISRVVTLADKRKGTGIVMDKCDLCRQARFKWDPQLRVKSDAKTNGASCEQACVAVCPVGAIRFTAQTPEQTGDSGYRVNLREKGWGELGYPTK
jgi:protein NrfC